MFRGIVSIIIFISLITISISPQEKNYNLLFKKGSSFHEAGLMLLNTYREITGNENVLGLKMKDVQFDFGKISFSVDTKPTTEQIEKLLVNKGLISYEIIINKNMYRETLEELNKSNQKLNFPKLRNYQIVLKYQHDANSAEEMKLIKDIFGNNDYVFEKDANKLDISIPEDKAERFIKKLMENENIVFVQEL